MSSSFKGALWGLLGFGIFAAHDVIVKMLAETYSVFQISFFAMVFGFPVAFLMLARDATAADLLPRRPVLVTLRSVMMSLTALCVFYAFSTIPFAQAYALLFVAPLLITGLSVPFLGERVGIRRFSAVVVGFVGVAVALNPSATTLQRGHGAALMAAVFISISSIILRKIGKEERPITLLLVQMMIGTVLYGVLMQESYVPPALNDLHALILMAGMAALAGMCIIFAYQRAPASIVAPTQYSQILWAIVYGALFFDETPTRYTVIGAAIIIGSGLYILNREETKLGSIRPAQRQRITNVASIVAASLAKKRSDPPTAPK